MELTAVDVQAWLAEDVRSGDVTSTTVIDEDAVCEARILVKEPGVVCGLAAAAAVFEALGARLEPLVADGARVDARPVARVEGPARAVLTGERLALNLLGRLSGIATLTRRYVHAVDGTRTTILDTRKTTPGLRELEKEAVRCGGGTNHRLGDRGCEPQMVVLDQDGVVEAGLPVGVECDTLAQVSEALEDASRRWLSLIRMASSRPRRWFVPPPQRTASFSSSRRPGVVLRVSRMIVRVPSTAST